MSKYAPLLLMALIFGLSACKEQASDIQAEIDEAAILETFGSNIDLTDLHNYEGQPLPDYIRKDNAGNNAITNEGATLGRVLFYDKHLSINNEISCASCHKQRHAFSDADIASTGVNGSTGRHSMRLVNARFSDEDQFFWDERATSLENQTTQPIQDHIEMGFSGMDGDPDFEQLTLKVSTERYYQSLFTFVYGDPAISEDRIQLALAQFVRSIQSFDSKYDRGRQQVQNDGANFPNFSSEENEGKQLFLQRPDFNADGMRIGGGLGCAGCHRPPEFDIDPESGNNGVVSSLNGEETDLTNTRSPSLRDLFNSEGLANGPFMHDGSFNTMHQVLDHYNDIQIGDNSDLDRRLRPGGVGQRLNMEASEVSAVISFLKTLSGVDMYVNEKWSDPFLN